MNTRNVILASVLVAVWGGLMVIDPFNVWHSHHWTWLTVSLFAISFGILEFLSEALSVWRWRVQKAIYIKRNNPFAMFDNLSTWWFTVPAVIAWPIASRLAMENPGLIALVAGGCVHVIAKTLWIWYHARSLDDTKKPRL